MTYVIHVYPLNVSLHCGHVSASLSQSFSADPKLGFFSRADLLTRTSVTLTDPTKAAGALRQAGIWRFDAVVAFAFVALVFLIAAGSAWEWWKLLRGTKPIVLHDSEFIPLSRVESGGA